jgi:hypothetical protein
MTTTKRDIAHGFEKGQKIAIFENQIDITAERRSGDHHYLVIDPLNENTANYQRNFESFLDIRNPRSKKLTPDKIFKQRTGAKCPRLDPVRVPDMVIKPTKPR